MGPGHLIRDHDQVRGPRSSKREQPDTGAVAATEGEDPQFREALEEQ